MKRQTWLPMLISKVIHLLRYEIFKTFKGRVVLQKIQTPPLLLLEGWSVRNKQQPGISKFWSSVDVSELRYVSERQIISKLWTKT